MPNGLLQGKRGLIMGLANDKSIAWGIAQCAHAQGAELAFTYQGEMLGKRVLPLAEQLGSDLVLPCDVTDPDAVRAAFDTAYEQWGRVDVLFNNAGMGKPPQTIDEISTEDWLQVVQINLNGERDAPSLQALEKNWLAPAWAGLASGAIDALTLVLPLGATSLVICRCGRRERRRFWRRRRPITALLGCATEFVGTGSVSL